ncbi:helix-turn-helix domain-containing protein [Gemmatimonas sp.]|uniref:helix-turn-helix domain-containing protein n=1 Tax=Gemmatimonas sp. TaxID=1962908 RepID=UPI00286EA5EC|nr:helix-turn-helix domain-containing protein [Gemmatimonas sp.]
MISFGRNSILLSIGTAHGLVLAALLWRASANRTANRLLALLVTIVALRVLPYIIGFAGFYDTWPWLSFMPYEWSLALGAVIWLYMHVICIGALPQRWGWHLLPAVVQGAYYTAVFVQPLDFKNHWDSVAHVPYVVPIETAWSFVALVVYLALAWRTQARYQHWLDTALSNREEYRLDWPRRFLIACSVTAAIWVSQTVYEAAVGGFTYFDRLPLYLWFSLLVYGLGLGGLRSAGLMYPRPEGLAEPEPQLVPTAPTEAMAALPNAERQADWREMGQRVDAEVRASGWWRDPDLTAPRLARLLATNTTYLSRALNEGLGVNFNEFINRIRVEAVQVELRAANADRDILTIALEAGFNSKASFNRVFKRVASVTPTEFKRSAHAATSQTP